MKLQDINFLRNTLNDYKNGCVLTPIGVKQVNQAFSILDEEEKDSAYSLYTRISRCMGMSNSELVVSDMRDLLCDMRDYIEQNVKP